MVPIARVNIGLMNRVCWPELRSINVGVVGCGRNSENHLRVYARTPGVRLAAVCDIEEARAELMGRKFGADRICTSMDSMIKLGLDLIDIVTPTPTHAPLTIQALESGHNVLVEKPMSLSSHECMEMISAARKSGYSLCVSHNKRFYESVMQAKQAIEEEQLTVSRMRVTHFFIFGGIRPNWILTEQSGGILWEAMVHHIYLLQHFLGPIERVHAVARKVSHPVHDSITLLTESRGRPGLGEYERRANAPLLAFQLFTEQGDRFDGDLFEDFTLRWPSRHMAGIPDTLMRFSDDLAAPAQKWKSRMRKSVRLPSYGAVTPYKKTFYVIIRRFLSFLAGERPEPPVKAEEGLQTIGVLEGARKSIETGEPQTIPE